MTDPRTQAREWLAITGWTVPQMLRGIRLTTRDVPHERQTHLWLTGKHMHTWLVGTVVRFIEENPTPGVYVDWQQAIASRASDRKAREDEDIIRRRDAVEQERRDRVARLLADERAPREPGTWFPSMRYLNRLDVV